MDGLRGCRGCLAQWLIILILIALLVLGAFALKWTWQWFPLALDPATAEVQVTGLEPETTTNSRGLTSTTYYARWWISGEEQGRIEVEAFLYTQLQATPKLERRLWIVSRRGHPGLARLG